MKAYRYPITLFFVFLFLSVFSQSLIKVKGPVKIGTSKINIGDTLVYNEPENFTNSFTYVFDNRPLTINKKRTFEYEGETYDYSLLKFPIKKIYKSSDDRIIISEGWIFNNYIDIKNALKSNEIFNYKKYKNLIENRKIFNSKLAFIYFFKLYNKYKDYLKEFMLIFNYDLFEKVHQDEFEFQNALNETDNILKKEMLKIDTATIYSILIPEKIGSYDFSKKVFKILWKKEPYSIYNKDIYYYSSKKINEININLENLSDFSYFPLEKERANNFIKSRKSDYGDVNRELYFSVNIKLDPIFNFRYGIVTLSGSVQSIDVFNRENYKNGYICSLK